MWQIGDETSSIEGSLITSPGIGQQCPSSTLYTALTHCDTEDETCVSTDDDLESVWNSIKEGIMYDSVSIMSVCIQTQDGNEWLDR